jgi:tape measure domain-containing protein
MATHVEEIILKLRDLFSGPMQEAEETTKKVRKETKKVDDQTKTLKKTLTDTFKAYVTVKTIKGIADLGIQMEQTRLQFATMIGDADKANDVLNNLGNFANKTGFEKNEVLDAAKALMEYGTPAEYVHAQLAAIGDISAGTGKDLSDLAELYGSVQESGVLSLTEINKLQGDGVPILKELSKVLGVNESQVKEFAKEGRIGFGALQTSFQNLTGEGGMFFNLMEKQSKTAGGQIAILKNSIADSATAIGEAMLPIIKAIIDKVKILTDWINQNKTAIAAWVPVIAKIIAVIAALVAIIKIWMFVQTAINFLLTANPIGLIIVAIGALIAIIALAISKYEDWGAALLLFMGPLGLVINLVQSFRRNWEGIKEAFTTGGIIEGLKKIGLVILDALLMPVQQLLELLGKIPGLDIATKGAENLENLRKNIMGIETGNPEEKANMRKATDAMALANMKKATKGLGLGESEGGLLNNISKTTNAAKSGVSGGLAGVTSTAPKNVTISIEKLVESLNINTTTLKEGTAEIQDQITKALLTAINDSQIQAG